MAALIFLFLNLAASLFKPRWRLEAENAALRQQLIVLQRKVRGRVEFTNSDRLFFIQLYRWFPSILKAITTFRPETLVRWHRAGFRRYWRWKSRNLGGRPQIAVDLRALIRRMSVENLLWGAPRIHGELLKLGFAVAQSTVAKYMAGRTDPSGQRWSTIAAGSPWQNSFAERLIGSIRRECVDHVIALGEQHLRQVLKSYASYYNTARTHRSLDKDAPISRRVQRIGRIVSHALVGGLHHQYARI
jgi:hypothetical protein